MRGNEVSRSVVKWSGVGWSVVKVLVKGCLTLLEDEVFCLYGFFFYHILSCSFGSMFFYRCIYGCMFCMLLFNFVSYVFLLLCWRILIVIYVLFCIFRFHRTNWHSSATMTEAFPCFSLVLRQMPGITRKEGARPALFPIGDNFYKSIVNFNLTTLGSNPIKPSNQSC